MEERTIENSEEDAAFFVEAMLSWYRANARDLPWRANREPYHVWLSEIMLQQTRVETARPYYERFLRELPTIRDLAEADEARLLKLWEGLGYYSRARNLQKAARAILSRHAGQFPRTLHEIAALPGVGDYTAGAVASICFEEATPAVDGNVLRVTARLTGDAAPADTPSQKRKARAMLERLYPKGACGDFTQSLMELGALVCLPGGAALCDVCPVSAVCAARRTGRVAELPVKSAKKARRKEEKTVFVLRCGDAIAVRRRERSGLLAGLWELPNTDGKLREADALRIAQDFGVCPVSIERKKERKHVFTHIEWSVTCYFILCEARDERFLWADARMLDEVIALPSAFGKLL
ncbi:MAG: A/G-specific adenine glycosylase [Clostridiales Family XIII bacterium]|jgi:A/G-specific adenine glycosylase|nr:A/G-specific adenine glycosylase [Clostridiales Family XIII bacterium]